MPASIFLFWKNPFVSRGFSFDVSGLIFFKGTSSFDGEGFIKRFS